MMEVLAELVEGASELYGVGGVWGYVLIFVLAAIPWFEVLVIVPAGVGLGFNPVAVSVVAFTGNMLPVLGIAALHRKFRFPAPDYFRTKAERVWDSHGVPGVALIAPGVTGVYVTMSVALALEAPRRKLVAWMAFSIAAWTVALAVLTYAGFELLLR